MEYLMIHVQEMPEMAKLGARYVVVACCGSWWRDGEVTSDARLIPRIEQELRKRFMNRLNSQAA